LVDLLREGQGETTHAAVLEWGCGPARIIRHLPALLGPSATVHGSDYNEASIRWIREHISNVQVEVNGLEPPLPYGDNTFDFIFAISVFTHLPEDGCIAWINELSRVLRPDGYLFFTTNGDKSAQLLLPRETETYQKEGTVCRGQIQEGKKMYGTWHSPHYVRDRLLCDYDVLKHLLPGRFQYIHDQDAWLAKPKQS